MTLVGWWPLHDDSAQDYSGKNNHGTLNGPTTGVAGRGGLEATAFDGTDDYIEVPHSASIDPDYITVSAWMRVPSGESNTRPIIKGPQGTTVVYNFYINTDSTPKPRFEVSVDGTYYSTTATVGISDDEWHFVTGTYDGSSVKIYVDGSLENENTNMRKHLINRRPK